MAVSATLNRCVADCSWALASILGLIDCQQATLNSLDCRVVSGCLSFNQRSIFVGFMLLNQDSCFMPFLPLGVFLTWKHLVSLLVV
jgi:hypothetical protein